jgi:iron(III) transport system substrate-binding protein
VKNLVKVIAGGNHQKGGDEKPRAFPQFSSAKARIEGGVFQRGEKMNDRFERPHSTGNCQSSDHRMCPSSVIFRLAALVAVLSLAAGCLKSHTDEVVVYAALDAEFSQPILDDFAQDTGIAPLPKFDIESTKTVGLANAIIAEQSRPRCDVFWNNEILNTLRLEELGLLEAYEPPAAAAFPQEFRSPTGTWHGFAARARVLVVNTQLVSEGEMPTSIYDLTREKWKGKIAIAKPLFGTTATHAACLFAVLGDEKAKDYFRALKANDVQIVSGNKQVATDVAAGRLAFGITDTDDAIIELAKGLPVKIVYPDRQPGELGTLFIPNTLAIIKGSPNPAEARKLIDYLLTPEIEIALSRGASAQIPLNVKVNVPLRVETPRTIKSMEIDFEEAVRKWDSAAQFVRDEFARAD